MGATNTSFRGRDLLALKQTVCLELDRVNGTIDCLQHRRDNEIAPDLSTGDLLEIFYEEQNRLRRQLQAIDESLLNLQREPVADLLEQNRQTERWRNALQSKNSAVRTR